MAKTSAVTTAPAIEPNGFRLSLQDDIRRRDEFYQAYLRRAEERKAAQGLVDSGDKTEKYLDRFDIESKRAHQALFEIDNNHPLILINGCTDQDLRDSWQVAREVRSRLGIEKQAAQANLETVSERRYKLQCRIASNQRRGQPAMLEAGQRPPWEPGGFIARVVGKTVATSEGTPVWALRGDDEIFFNPRENHPANINEYEMQWFQLSAEIRIARKGFESIQKRWAEADKEYADLRNKMIWSPI